VQETKVRGIMMPRNKAPSVLCVLLASLVLQGAAEHAPVGVEDHPAFIDCLAKQDPADPNDTCTSLVLTEVELSGTIPTTVGLLTKLTEFDVSNTGKLDCTNNPWNAPLWYYDGYSHCEDPSNNVITGPIPTEVGLLTKLTKFWVANNQIGFNGATAIPTEVGLMTEMESFWVSDNHITGPIPTEVGMMTKMNEGFWVTRNAITGPIPTEVGLMTETMSFSVEGNAITGPIPTELGMMTKMNGEGFRASDNAITGSIPTEVGMMMGMQSFEAINNAITGPIPSELGMLSNTISYLGLDDNQLTGDIPTEIGLLTELSYLSLAQNSLSGSLPAELEELESGPPTVLFVHHNEDLCGSLIPIQSTSFSCGRVTADPSMQYYRGHNHGHLSTPNWDYDEGAYCDPLEDTQLGNDCADSRNDIMRATVSGDTTALAAAIATEQDIDLMHDKTVDGFSLFGFSEFGYNALMLAAQYDHQDVARMLLDAGANPDLLTSVSKPPKNNNWSNVMVAAWYGDQEMMSMFLAASTTHLNEPCDDKQMTPLHAAVSQDHCKTAAILVDAGANLNAVDSDGKTPLHYAAKDGNHKCLMTLMHAGADASIEDGMGNTAYALAQAGEHNAIMSALPVPVADDR